MRKSYLSIIFCLLLVVSFVSASCKEDDENNQPLDPDNMNNRLFTYDPFAPTSPTTEKLTITTYNIQSGLSFKCVQNLAKQFKQLVGGQYFASQEVDVNTTHCNCDQPSDAATATGFKTFYLRTINYQTGYYGHMAGTQYPVLDVQFLIYQHYTTEVRGAIAQRSQPPQLGGRDLWVISTHFQYDDVETRTKTAVELINFAKKLGNQYPNAVIICPGDFYVQYGDSDYATLTSYFKDAWYEFARKHTGGSTYPSNKPAYRFDYMFYRAPAGVTMSVDSYSVPKVQYSDHAPLRVAFNFGGVVAPRSIEEEQAETGTETEAVDGEVQLFDNNEINPVDKTDCIASYKLVERVDAAYAADGKTYRTFDIRIINNGRCTVTYAKLSVPDADLITNSWNYDSITGEVSLYGVMTHTENSAAGFITTSTSDFASAHLSYDCFTCLPAQHDNNAGDTQDYCGVKVELTTRFGPGSSWTDGVLNYQVYDISATNYGSRPVSEIIMSLTTSGRVSQVWNLDSVAASTDYSFALWGNRMASGQTFSKTAGFIVSYSDIAPANAAWLVSAKCE